MTDVPDGDWEIFGVADICGLSQLPDPVIGTLDAERFVTFYDADSDAVLLVATDDVEPSDLDAAPDSELATTEEALARVRDAIAALRGVPAPALDTEKAATLSNCQDGLLSLERQFQNEAEQHLEAGDPHE